MGMWTDPVIHQDINKWNKNEFTVMERRLSRFIPLIRFYYISSEDFLLKIYPFKELFSNNLINNIFEYHMVPNNRKNIDIQPRRYNSSIKTFLLFLQVGLKSKIILIIMIEIFLIDLNYFIMLVGTVVQLQHFMKNVIIRELL